MVVVVVGATVVVVVVVGGRLAEGVGIRVVVVIGAFGLIVVGVVSIIVNRVFNSSSFREVCPKTTGGVGAVVIVLHFSSIIIEGLVVVNIKAEAINPNPSPAPNKIEPNITLFLVSIIPYNQKTRILNVSVAISH